MAYCCDYVRYNRTANLIDRPVHALDPREGVPTLRSNRANRLPFRRYIDLYDWVSKPREGDLVLRKKLEEMTHVEDVSRHPALLVALTIECPNTIKLLDSPHPIRDYTCLMHVFDFAEKPEYMAMASHGFGQIYAAGRFAHWMLDRGLLVEVIQADVCEGDLVFYFGDDGRFKHAGLCLTSGRIVSKWGIGHLYEHELFDVPESYATKVRFFSKLSYEQAFGNFMRFAEDNGLSF